MARLEYTPPSQTEMIADLAADRRLAILADPAWMGELRLRFILWTLENRGYTFYLVHDELPNIGSHTTHEGLERLPDKPESALIISDPEVAPELIRVAYQNGCKRVWLHSGSSSPEAVAKAGEYGLDALHDLCLLCYLEPVKGPYALLRWLDIKMRERADRNLAVGHEAGKEEVGEQEAKAEEAGTEEKEAEQEEAEEEEPRQEWMQVRKRWAPKSKARKRRVGRGRQEVAGADEEGSKEAGQEDVGREEAGAEEEEVKGTKKDETPPAMKDLETPTAQDADAADTTKPTKNAEPAEDTTPAQDDGPKETTTPAQDA